MLDICGEKDLEERRILLVRKLRRYAIYNDNIMLRIIQFSSKDLKV